MRDIDAMQSKLFWLETFLFSCTVQAFITYGKEVGFLTFALFCFSNASVTGSSKSVEKGANIHVFRPIPGMLHCFRKLLISFPRKPLVIRVNPRKAWFTPEQLEDVSMGFEDIQRMEATVNRAMQCYHFPKVI